MVKSQQEANKAVVQRRDEAIRRALNTPPKLHKDMKKGAKKKQDDRPATSSEKRT
jgi:hypothetical protein